MTAKVVSVLKPYANGDSRVTLRVPGGSFTKGESLTVERPAPVPPTPPEPPPTPPEPPAPVQGDVMMLVLDGAAQPIVGATVTRIDNGETRTSDGSGFVHFWNPAPAIYRVEAAGYVTTERDLPPWTDKHRVHLEKSTAPQPPPSGTPADIVKAVDRSQPHLLRHNTHAACGEFLQRVVQALGGDWGHLSKSAGENGVTFPNGVRVSHDVIALPDGQRFDIIQSAGAHPAPASPGWGVIPPDQWRPSNVWVAPQPFFDSHTPRDESMHVARLGFGWFCFLRALRDWPAETMANFDWLETHLDPDYYRVFLFVEGIDHGTPDPWRDAGVTLTADWTTMFQNVAVLLKSRRKKMMVTLFGGHHFNIRACVDRFIAAAHDHWDAIEAVECVNEYLVNRFTADEVRDIGRYVRVRLPAQIPLALSSPHAAHNPESDVNEDMLASFSELYLGDAGGANEITIHVCRDNGKWSDPFNFNMFYPTFPKTSGEPRGPGASAGGDVSDPAILVADYTRASDAGWKRYTGHSAWSVFNGRIPVEYQGGGTRYQEKNVWEHQNMLQICNGWKAARANQ